MTESDEAKLKIFFEQGTSIFPDFLGDFSHFCTSVSDHDRSWLIVQFEETTIDVIVIDNQEPLLDLYGNRQPRSAIVIEKSVIGPKTTIAIVIETAIDKPCKILINFDQKYLPMFPQLICLRNEDAMVR